MCASALPKKTAMVPETEVEVATEAEVEVEVKVEVETEAETEVGVYCKRSAPCHAGAVSLYLKKNNFPCSTAPFTK